LGSLLHVDLYRLSSAAGIGELGFLDEPEALVLVEWPDRAPKLLTRAHLRLGLSMPEGGAGRRIVLETGDPELAASLKALAARFPDRPSR